MGNPINILFHLTVPLWGTVESLPILGEIFDANLSSSYSIR